MRQQFFKRFDLDGFDNVKWALEEHVKCTDTGLFNSFTLTGNEDSPSEIQFYTQEEPTCMDIPAFVWIPVLAGKITSNFNDIHGLDEHAEPPLLNYPPKEKERYELPF